MIRIFIKQLQDFNMEYEEYFLKIYSHFNVVNGVERSLILDLHKDTFFVVPRTLGEIIELFNKKLPLSHVYKEYGNENRIILDEYVQFIKLNKIGFLTSSSEFDKFLKLDSNLNEPFKITNCIVEIGKTTINQINSICSQIEKLRFKSIQIIFYENIRKELLLDLITKFNFNGTHSVELVLKYSKELDDFFKNGNNFKFLSNVYFHSSDKNYENHNHFGLLINYLIVQVKDFSYCGVVNQFYFNVNKNKVLESINHNSCLHKKISIDKDGNIKNCPSMPQSFGNIKDTTLEEAINHPDFKKYWNVNKDMIQVCKDCEFRHICTDCRAYTERNHFEGEIDLSKPLKCGYNPYTNEWAEWSTNPLKQKAIEFYGMQDLVKKDA